MHVPQQITKEKNNQELVEQRLPGESKYTGVRLDKHNQIFQRLSPRNKQ